jgi:hypothetical protein
LIPSLAWLAALQLSVKEDYAQRDATGFYDPLYY